MEGKHTEAAPDRRAEDGGEAAKPPEIVPFFSSGGEAA